MEKNEKPGSGESTTTNATGGRISFAWYSKVSEKEDINESKTMAYLKAAELSEKAQIKKSTVQSKKSWTWKESDQQKLMYKCPLCPQKFNRTETSNAHILEYHKVEVNSRPTYCTLCGEGFIHNVVLNQHTKANHPGAVSVLTDGIRDINIAQEASREVDGALNSVASQTEGEIKLSNQPADKSISKHAIKVGAESYPAPKELVDVHKQQPRRKCSICRKTLSKANYQTHKNKLHGNDGKEVAKQTEIPETFGNTFSGLEKTLNKSYVGSRRRCSNCGRDYAASYVIQHKKRAHPNSSVSGTAVKSSTTRQSTRNPAARKTINH